MSLERNDAIKQIRSALRKRSGKAWSVTGGRGTSWGWITITAPPARSTGYGSMNEADQAELSELLGQQIGHQGASIPSGSEYRQEYVDRANGRTPAVFGTPYWD